MRAILATLAIILCFVSGCSNAPANPLKGNAIIDWVDFVKLNGQMYNGIWEGVVKNSADVTDTVVGKVRFTLSGAVSNPDYRTQEGDAAFLVEGTELYRVQGFDETQLIAAKDDTKIGGFRLYAEEGFAKTIRSAYRDLDRAKVEQIDLHKNEETKPYRTLRDDEMQRFIKLLDSGEDKANFQYDTKNGDPKYRSMVFYTDGPIAYSFMIADDGVNVFFSPWETRIVDGEIRQLLQG